MEQKNNTFEEIWARLMSAGKILIPLHPKPDGDSFGAATAMAHALKKCGKEVRLISKDVLNENLIKFEFSKEIEFGVELTENSLREFDVLLFLDHGSLIGHPNDIIEKKFPENLTVINIDHHHMNGDFGNLRYIDSTKPSCCSIVFELLKKANVEFDGKICRRILLGICTDTNFFVHGDSLDSIKKVEFLIEKGNINYAKEIYYPLSSKTWGLAKLQGIFLSNLDKTEIGGINIAYSYVTEEEAGSLNLAEIRLGIMCIQDLSDMPIVFTLTELEDKIKGSFRSRGYDTTLFSKELGGGGHKQASAFYLEKIPMDKAIKKVLEIIEKVGIHKL